MPTPGRSLPAVIGPAEAALGALLRAVLAATPIDGRDEWAAINVVDRHDGSGEEVHRAVAAPLGIPPADARAVLARMVAKGLLASDGVSWTLSHDGATVLEQARSSVVAVTGHLVEGLPLAEIEAAVRVLDHVRTRAEDELARLT